MKKASTKKTYDPKCYELAEYFLAGNPELDNEGCKNMLAVEIQMCVEDELTYMKSCVEQTSK